MEPLRACWDTLPTQGRRKTTLTTGSGRKMSFFAREPPKENVPYQLYDGPTVVERRKEAVITLISVIDVI